MKSLAVNGWTIYAHPMFWEKTEMLAAKVKQL